MIEVSCLTVLEGRSSRSRCWSGRFLQRTVRKNLLPASLLAPGRLQAIFAVPWLVETLPWISAFSLRCHSPCLCIPVFPCYRDTCPLGPARAVLQRMSNTRGRSQAPRGAGAGNTRGRGHADRAGLQQQGRSQGHGVEASLGPRGTGADSEVGGCFPKASLLEAGGSPRAPRGPENILTVCVVFKSDSRGSMTHFRAAELQKLRSARVASAGPPGTTARLTWKKRMKEPLAIRPVPSLLSQNRTLGSWASLC